MKLKHISLAAAALSLQITYVSANFESVAAQASAKKAKEDDEAKKKEHLMTRFKERDLIAQFNLPDTWCQDGTRKVLHSQDAVLNVRCPPCYHGHYPNGAAWFQDEANEYKQDETFESITGEEKTHPYFIFYKLNTIACLPKTMDQEALDKIVSLEDIDKSIETYKHKDMFRVNQHLEVVSDRFDYGSMKAPEIDAYLASRGFHKDPELVIEQTEAREEKEKSGKAAEERKQREEVAEAAKGAKGHFDKETEDL